MRVDTNSVLESFSDAILLLDRDGLIQFVNTAANKMLEYPGSDLLQQHISIIYGAGGDRIRGEYELLTAQKTGLFKNEGWKTKKNGERFWGSFFITPIYEQDKLSGFTCIIRDVSFERNQQLKLRQNEERFRLMVESVKDYSIFC